MVCELTININARSLQRSEPTISFEQVVGQWHRRDPDCHVQGKLPLINWKVEDSVSTGAPADGQPATRLVRG